MTTFLVATSALPYEHQASIYAKREPYEHQVASIYAKREPYEKREPQGEHSSNSRSDTSEKRAPQGEHPINSKGETSEKRSATITVNNEHAII